MIKKILEIALSPCCKSGLSFWPDHIVLDPVDENKIDQGILYCAVCQREFPVIDGIPRLCLDLLKEEAKALALFKARGRTGEPSDALRFNVKDPVLQIEQLIRKKISIPDNASPYLRKRMENEVLFRLHDCEQQEKFVDTLAAYYKGTCAHVLEVGGGQGGLAKCLIKALKPQLYVMVDLDLEWAQVARLRNPDAEIIRGDAANLPIRDSAFDVVISQAMLEHVRDYNAALDEMCRITRAALFIAWGPNKNALYDFGHLDAPVTVFPKKMARKVARVWHKIRDSGRSKGSIDAELDCTFYISTNVVKRRLKEYGRVFNVFTAFAMNSLKSRYSYRGTGIKCFLARSSFVSKCLFKSLEFLTIEPQCYYILLKQKECPR